MLETRIAAWRCHHRTGPRQRPLTPQATPQVPGAVAARRGEARARTTYRPTPATSPVPARCRSSTLQVLRTPRPPRRGELIFAQTPTPPSRRPRPRGTSAGPTSGYDPVVGSLEGGPAATLLARQLTARCSSLLGPGRDEPQGQPGVHRQLIEWPAPPPCRASQSGTGVRRPRALRCDNVWLQRGNSMPDGWKVKPRFFCADPGLMGILCAPPPFATLSRSGPLSRGPATDAPGPTFPLPPPSMTSSPPRSSSRGSADRRSGTRPPPTTTSAVAGHRGDHVRSGSDLAGSHGSQSILRLRWTTPPADKQH